MAESDKLTWAGPFAVREWITSFLDRSDCDWPPEVPGVYAVSLEKWQERPSESNTILYVGCSENLLGRVGDLVSVLLGFYDSGAGAKPIGRHSGWKIRKFCCASPHVRSIMIGDLFFGWAATSVPCHSCIETELVQRLKPEKECQAGTSRVACCCPL